MGTYIMEFKTHKSWDHQEKIIQRIEAHNLDIRALFLDMGTNGKN